MKTLPQEQLGCCSSTSSVTACRNTEPLAENATGQIARSDSKPAVIAAHHSARRGVDFRPTASKGPSVKPITVFDGSTMSAITDLPSCVTRIDTNSKQAVDANEKSLNEKSFTARFKFGGKDSDTHSANALKIATGTTSAVKVVVYAMCSNKTNTGSVKAAGSGAAVTLLTNDGAALVASEEVSVTPDSDGNIYVWAADNAMNVYYLYISQ